MDVRKKVLLDLFASPGTLVPIVGGLSTLILSWALDAGQAWNMVGLAGVLGGLGWFATKVVIGLEKITADAYDYVKAQQIRKQEENLDELDEKLRKDRDPRTQESLRELRRVYSGFAEDVKSGKIPPVAHDVVDIVDELFRTSVEQLERTYELWESAKDSNGSVREKLLAERDEIIGEVLESVRYLEGTRAKFQSIKEKRKGKQLKRLRTELDEALQVARRTEERIAAWDAGPYNRTETE